MESLTTPLYRSYQGGYFQTLIAPDQTGNTLALLELTLPKGAEPPAHIHTLEDEAFYVLEGEISVTVADKVTALKAGEALYAPRNIPHSFKILTEKATIMNLITPGTLWNYFMECSEPISQKPETVGPVALSPEKMKTMLDKISNVYKVNFL
ncbi:Cupin domain-containing protein [Chitinophaga costaii]|uniref:Cupin domain-containing protein n=1 Tax=Chitinophaga costaii TaxID=1335309 RepID=A0A1C4BAM6_9BACT|nr:cupin domain-containing protein [Chitinophaga costaii]PUZ27690.1 cupin domain-containing protein [Chitinophaga costaii]SCC03738.1 Cupin domain-containing protein [Chitinophaga costaii]